MGGWMDGWVDGWMGGMDGGMDGWVSVGGRSHRSQGVVEVVDGEEVEFNSLFEIIVLHVV